MKKRMVLIAIATMMSVTTGCGGSEEAVETSVETTVETTEETTTEEETTSEPETIVVETTPAPLEETSEEILEPNIADEYVEEYWDDGTGLEGVLHKSEDPWGVNWSNYHYYEWESLYRKNGGNGDIKVVTAGYVDQMLDGAISLVVNYNSPDDYHNAIVQGNPDDLQRIVVFLQDGYTIDPNAMYLEGDILTVYGTAVPNIEMEMVAGSSMFPSILAADIIMEDPTSFTVQNLNEMLAYSDWENGWSDQ